MTVPNMPTLPDCTLCGGPVVLDPEGDRGPVEACTECGNAQRVLPVSGGIRRAVREVAAQVRREGLPVMRCPSCKRNRCDRCHSTGCECADGDHPLRPTLDGLALLATETPGHLDPTELPEGGC